MLVTAALECDVVSNDQLADADAQRSTTRRSCEQLCRLIGTGLATPNEITSYRTAMESAHEACCDRDTLLETVCTEALSSPKPIDGVNALKDAASTT